MQEVIDQWEKRRHKKNSVFSVLQENILCLSPSVSIPISRFKKLQADTGFHYSFLYSKRVLVYLVLNPVLKLQKKS